VLISHDAVVLHWMCQKGGDILGQYDRLDVETFLYGDGAQIFGGDEKILETFRKMR